MIVNPLSLTISTNHMMMKKLLQNFTIISKEGSGNKDPTDIPRDPRCIKFNKSGGLQDRVVDPPQSPPPPTQTELSPPPSPSRQDDPPIIGVDF